MRKPIIVFSLVMVLAPLPTFIPWLYETWSTDTNLHETATTDTVWPVNPNGNDPDVDVWTATTEVVCMERIAKLEGNDDHDKVGN